MSKNRQISTPEHLAGMHELNRALSTLPQVEEKLFVERYLPVLASRDAGEYVAVWREVVPDPTARVEVVSNGKVLFTVPPLLHSASIRDNGDTRNTISEILNTAALKSEQHPRLGMNYLDESLNAKVENIENEVTLLSEWNSILDRYGYPVIAADKIGTTTTTAKKADDKVEFEGYDEL